MRLLALLLLLWGSACAAEVKVSTWNLDWLTLRSAADADLPSDVRTRQPEDFAALRRYAVKLDSDVIAFQEVDGPAAAAAIFDPSRYQIVTIDEDVVQRVGLAVSRAIGVERHPDYSALDVAAFAKHRLRDGLDATLRFRDGQALRVLVVHLKTGCQRDAMERSTRPSCALLAQQVPPLAAWVAARQAEGVAFLVLGDFNRVFDWPETMGAALAQAAPLLRVTEGYADPCWDAGRAQEFIDHIFAGGPARNWIVPGTLRVQVFHETGSLWRERLSDHCPVSIKLAIP